MSARPIDRRSFVARAGASVVGGGLWRTDLDALGHQLSGLPTDQETYWEVVRAAFSIPEDRIYLNVGTLGPQPRAVTDAVVETTRQVAATYPPAIDWEGIKARLAGLLSCDPAGLVFPRNTTEAMSFVASGIDWARGDEILTTNHEHIGGLSCWQLAAARHGLTLRQLPLPDARAEPAEVVERFRSALTPRTRLVSLSHLTFTNGALLPVREIVSLCREHGVISVLDGAHPPGLLRFDLTEIDPDFYASSPHKWLLAPQGSGLLYIREDWRARLWPTLASGGWDDLELGAQRFNHMGTMDASRLAGLDAAARFHLAVGPDRVEARIRALRHRLLDRLSALRRVRIQSPVADSRAAGMVSFTIDGIDALSVQRRLARAANVRTRVIGEHGLGWMRLSPHIYNREAEIDRVVDLIESI